MCRFLDVSKTVQEVIPTRSPREIPNFRRSTGVGWDSLGLSRRHPGSVDITIFGSSTRTVSELSFGDLTWSPVVCWTGDVSRVGWTESLGTPVRRVEWDVRDKGRCKTKDTQDDDRGVWDLYPSVNSH